MAGNLAFQRTLSLLLVALFGSSQSVRAADDLPTAKFDLYAAVGRVATPGDWSTPVNRNSADDKVPTGGSIPAIAGQPVDLASPNSGIASIYSLDREILKTLVKIQRLSTSFRLASTSQPSLRQWRQSIYVETNSGCTISGTIDAMRLNYPNIHRPATVFSITKNTDSSGHVTEQLTSKLADPRRIRPALSQSVQEPQVVGNCVNLCGDIFELSSNAHRWFQLKDMGLDSKSYRLQVLAIKADLDAQLDRREQLERALEATAQERKVLECEGRLQRDLRDLLMVEYGQYHSSAIRLHWFQNAAYGLDFAKNSTGAAGGIVSIEGNHLRLAKWAGAAGLLTTTSGLLILVIPFAGRVAGNWAGTVDRRIVNRDYGETIAKNTSDARRDRTALIESLAQLGQPESAASKDRLVRLYAYSQLCDIMKDHEANIKRWRAGAKRATIENIIYASITGSTKVSLGVCGMVAGWHYYNSPWMESRLQAAGNTAYTCGTTFSLLENARVLYENEVTHYRLQDEHLLPSQLYKSRLDKLQMVERKLNETGS